MSVEKLYKLRDMLCKELDGLAESGKLSQTTVQMADTLLHAVKNLDKVVEAEEGSGSYRGWAYGDSAYRGRSYGDGYSMRRDSMGRYARTNGGYSRDGEKERLASELERMMRNVGGESEHQVLQQCLELIDKM